MVVNRSLTWTLLKVRAFDKHCKQINVNAALIQCLLFQVTTAAVEQYTGEGEPPYCEMTLRATDNKTTPPDVTVEAEFKGVQIEPTIIKFEKEAQNVVECVCQVFYHKMALNHWRARFAFFPKKHEGVNDYTVVILLIFLVS